SDRLGRPSEFAPALTANTAANTTITTPIGLTRDQGALDARALPGLLPITKDAAAASATRPSRCGRTTDINHAPGIATSTPRTSLPLKMCAVPSAADPIANCINASLPIEDGQNRMLGTNMTIMKYRRRSRNGTASTVARYQR